MYVTPSQQGIPPERQMNETLYTRQRGTVEPMMVKNDRKTRLKALHTDAVDKAVKCHERKARWSAFAYKQFWKRIDQRGTFNPRAQLRSGYCRLLGSYKSRIKKDASLNVCVDCGTTPHDVKHLFTFPAHPTTVIPSDLWSRPTDDVRDPKVRDPDWNEHGLKG